MGKRAAIEAPVRQSERASKAPARFRPGASADVPTELLDLIRDVASSAAARSDVPFEPSAVTALEEALEPMLEALCVRCCCKPNRRLAKRMRALLLRPTLEFRVRRRLRSSMLRPTVARRSRRPISRP